jgi:hypothetical protein
MQGTNKREARKPVSDKVCCGEQHCITKPKHKTTTQYNDMQQYIYKFHFKDSYSL